MLRRVSKVHNQASSKLFSQSYTYSEDFFSIQEALQIGLDAINNRPQIIV